MGGGESRGSSLGTPVPFRMASSRFLFCFRSFARLFWNQIFTCGGRQKNKIKILETCRLLNAVGSRGRKVLLHYSEDYLVCMREGRIMEKIRVQRTLVNEKGNDEIPRKKSCK